MQSMLQQPWPTETHCCLLQILVCFCSFLRSPGNSAYYAFQASLVVFLFCLAAELHTHLSCYKSSSSHGIFQKHRPGHKAHSAWHRRYPRCFLLYRVKVKVSSQPAIEMGYPNINNDYVFLYHVCSKHKSLTVTHRSNNHICTA